MSDSNKIDYGPLQPLIGTWNGDKGKDVAPEPDGVENNPYYETIIFSGVEDYVTNAEEQVLAAVHYRQVVKRKSNDIVFHDETGYWMWDASGGIIMHSLNIPRAVSLLAGGKHNGQSESDGSMVLEVSADQNSQDWQIIQSPFMRDNARTTNFKHKIVIANDVLSYSETTMVDIYGSEFEHTDNNELRRQ